MRFKKNISKEELLALPLRAFGKEIITVDSPATVTACVEYLNKQTLLGFDTETKPCFAPRSKNNVALLQLSSEDKAFLIRTCKIGLPKAIADILANPNIIKMGVAIKDDIRGLQKWQKFVPQGFIELGDYSNKFGIEACGLKKLCGIVLGFRISKSQQLSNWEEYTLKPSQKLYAATDAWVGLMIYNKLKNIENIMNKPLIQNIIKEYKKHYADEPMIIRSPGRINLIGEHTDYNEGYVLPCAVTPAIYFAIGKRGDNKVNLHSYDFNSYCGFTTHQKDAPREQWASYLYGITQIIQGKGHQISGFNCVFGGDVPVGAGMSSSAALEGGLCLGISEMNGLNLDKMEMAKIGQQSEHEYVGVKCGIMDQFASIFGKKDQCMRLDCRSLEYEYNSVKLNGYTIMLTDTKVKHSLASSEYNTRRQECATGVEAIKAKYPEVNSLRDASIEQLDNVKDQISDTVYKRCKYVIEEDNRVIAACNALNSNDLDTFGSLLYGSHNGLSKMYNVSCKELDWLVDQTMDMDYVLGSRMMGGGFGGCTLSIIKTDKVKEYKGIIAPRYRETFGHDCAFYEANADEGTEII